MKKFSEQNRYSFLLICMLFVIAVMPVIMAYLNIRLIVCIALSVLYISAIYSFTHKKIVFIIGIILTIITIITIWLSFIFHNFIVILAEHMSNIILLSFITYFIFISTFKSKIINRGVIHGAILVYLLIGFLWSYIYAFIGYLDPGSFTKMGEPLKSGYQTYMYFSFVTLTTLGFGDIIPVTPLARSLVILEAIIGQVYLIINVSWLVGLYVAHTRDQRKL